MPSVRCKLVDARIAIAVGDIDVTLRRECGMRAAMKWAAAHEWSGLARYTDFKQWSAVERALAHAMIAIVRAVDGLIRTDVDARTCRAPMCEARSPDGPGR